MNVTGSANPLLTLVAESFGQQLESSTHNCATAQQSQPHPPNLLYKYFFTSPASSILNNKANITQIYQNPNVKLPLVSKSRNRNSKHHISTLRNRQDGWLGHRYENRKQDSRFRRWSSRDGCARKVCIECSTEKWCCYWDREEIWCWKFCMFLYYSSPSAARVPSTAIPWSWVLHMADQPLLL